MSQNNLQSNDEKWMAYAINLARKGLYTTTPNPRVGCVIVDQEGHKVGDGAHLKAGEPHAEVFALRQAGEKAAGATAYVTLEPCSHTGRTPPCTDALLRAKIGRVVIANLDPNPSVDGTGVDKLKAHGVDVTIDVLAQEAEQLNLGFFKRMRKNRPYVRVKMAASLDGRTALHNGKSQWITGVEARKDVQHFRATSCAVLTGSGTVIDDDPSLLVRPEQAELADYPDLPLRQPLRVVLDGRNQLTPHFQLFNDNHRTHVVTQHDYDHSKFADSVSFYQATATYGSRLDLDQVLAHLSDLQCNNVWVEAGSKLAGAFIEEGLVDELIVYIAPKLLGNTGLPLLKLPQYEELNEAPVLTMKDQVTLGNDLRLTYTFQ